MNPRHLSDTNEHYTPAYLVDAARQAMGGIDLDPASCAEANDLVQASTFYDADQDGFVRHWSGRTFLNPPGGKSDNLQRRVLNKCTETGECGLPIGHTHEGTESSQKKWWFKLAREWRERRIEQAIFVCFSIELLQTTQVDPPEWLLLPLDCVACFPSRRVPYDKIVDGRRVSGKSPPHASAIFYIGPWVREFAEAFEGIGRILGA